MACLQGETVEEISIREGINEATLYWINSKSMHTEMKKYTGVGCTSTDNDNFQPMDLSGFGRSQPITWGGKGKRYIRGRFRWEATRPLIPAVASFGWEWSDFIMCVCHEPMRGTEWMVYGLFKYTRTRSAKEVNKWLQDRGVTQQMEVQKETVKKPVINYGSDAKKWFLKDPLDPTKPLWESAVDYIDNGRKDTKAVWLSYILLQEVMQQPYLTKEQQAQYAPRSFDYFLSYVMRCN